MFSLVSSEMRASLPLLFFKCQMLFRQHSKKVDSLASVLPIRKTTPIPSLYRLSNIKLKYPEKVKRKCGSHNIPAAQRLRRRECPNSIRRTSNSSPRRRSWSKPVLEAHRPRWHLCIEKILGRMRLICRIYLDGFSPCFGLRGRGLLLGGLLR